ncbi:hypothetical protein SPE_0112 [Spiroplasma eriocheiris CCTCC M 207170]|nr:hypothetical protein SPE_0112 [Spiroplasma eriocheiris CCTCC M 207170]
MMTFFVQELGLSGVRFDDGVTGPGIAKLSNNNQNIKVILNGTDPSRELEYIISANANKENLISCWNFYPQRYTASSIAFFAERLAYVHQCGIKMQAFVALQRTDTVGPWAYNDKLPSLEFHRDLPLDFQIRHLMAMGVEDIAISTQFINEAEFAIIKDINLNKISLAIAIDPELSPVEQAILFDQEVHFVRQDLAEYLIRSTWSRIKYHEQDIPVRGAVKEFQPGDVVILNNKAKNYAGELHIILKPMPNDGIRNLVGHLDVNEQEIVKYLQPNTEFVFNQKR